jgi:ASC-1-like (ASCH) protein
MKVKPEYFEKIKSGKKIYEIRLLDDKRKMLKVGDTVLLKKEPELFDGIVIRISEIKHFNTFLEMAQRLSIKDIGFEGKTAAEVNDIYHTIYSVEDEVKYGVVALKMEVL